MSKILFTRSMRHLLLCGVWAAALLVSVFVGDEAYSLKYLSLLLVYGLAVAHMELHYLWRHREAENETTLARARAYEMASGQPLRPGSAASPPPGARAKTNRTMWDGEP